MTDKELDCLIIVQTLASQPLIENPVGSNELLFNIFIAWAKDKMGRDTQTNTSRPEGESQSKLSNKVKVLVDIMEVLTAEERKEYFNLYIQNALKSMAKENPFGVGGLYGPTVIGVGDVFPRRKYDEDEDLPSLDK